MTHETALLLSFGALASGPLIAGLLHREARLHALLDGFILVMVGGMALLHLLPHAFESIGMWALALALVGAIIPLVAEHWLGTRHHSESAVFLVLAMLGLSLHASFDGTALASGGAVGSDRTDLGVMLAIILHRLPIGLLVWWSVRPRLGTGAAVSLLILVGGSTLAGFLFGSDLSNWGHGMGAGVVTALLAGGLMHVILDHHHHDDHCDEDRKNAYAAIGAFLGIAVFAILPDTLPPVVHRAAANVRTLLFESSFAVVLGFVGAGLLTMVPARSVTRLMSGGSSFSSALRGILVGLPLPICSCGVVPLFRGLHRARVPSAAAIGFLIATPELGVDAVMISIPLLGIRLTLIRLAAAFLVALAAGMLAGALSKDGDDPPQAPSTDDRTMAGGNSFGQAMRFGLRESVDDLGPWILAGIVVAAFIEPVLKESLVAAVPAIAQVPLFGALATPFYICASGATPLGAVFLSKGVAAGAVVAFLLTGPATNVTTFGALRSAYRMSVTVILIIAVPLISIVMGWLILLLPGVSIGAPPLQPEHAHPSPLQIVGVAAFALLLLVSIFQRGPRAFLNELGVGRTEPAHTATSSVVPEAATEPGQP